MKSRNIPRATPVSKSDAGGFGASWIVRRPRLVPMVVTGRMVPGPRQVRQVRLRSGGVKTSRITDEQVATWQEHGFAVVPDFLSAAEVEAARENLRRHFPTAEEYFSARERYRNLPTMIEFP